jgi:hypothetical protein
MFGTLAEVARNREPDRLRAPEVMNHITRGGGLAVIRKNPLPFYTESVSLSQTLSSFSFSKY